MRKTHSCGALRRADIGKKVVLCGWIAARRDHGGLIFIDLRDREGVTQLVFNPEVDKKLLINARSLKSEFVIEVTGEVTRRPNGTENPKLPTGEVEVLAKELKILNPSLTPPFEIADDIKISEDLRLTYRWLDLRRPWMQRNLKERHRATQLIRGFLDKDGFIEVETPALTKSTPEGARDYLVPSRLNPGKFYALPQSPQLFKQIMMVAGFERYFQIARCFRDEDLRRDRQPEHTQIDIEMSFIEREDIFDLVERMLVKLFKQMLGVKLKRPFRRITYHEAMSRFGTDKPDPRFGMELVDVTHIVKEADFKVFKDVIKDGGLVKGINAKGCSRYSSRELERLTEFVGAFGAKGLAWFKVVKHGLSSPIAKFFEARTLASLAAAVKAEVGDLLLFVAAKEDVVGGSLAQLRLHLAHKLNLIPKGSYELTWVLDFPLLEWNEDEQRYQSRHHPFTSPVDEDVGLLSAEPAKVRAKAYDLILNGIEIGGGSIRIHKEEVQQKAFETLGIGSKEARKRFGFLLEALKYGAPPHGGIALGLDRLLMIMLNLATIRDVIAFPKTQKAICLMTGAPTEVEPKQLKELSLTVKA